MILEERLTDKSKSVLVHKVGFSIIQKLSRRLNWIAFSQSCLKISLASGNCILMELMMSFSDDWYREVKEWTFYPETTPFSWISFLSATTCGILMFISLAVSNKLFVLISISPKSMSLKTNKKCKLNPICTYLPTIENGLKSSSGLTLDSV